MFLEIEDGIKEEIERLIGNKYKNNFLNYDDVIGLIEDLIYELKKATEEYEELKGNIDTYYKPISPAEYYEISDKEFI